MLVWRHCQTHLGEVMKYASGPLIALLNSNSVFRMADLYTVNTKSGLVARWTTADTDIWYGGNLFVAAVDPGYAQATADGSTTKFAYTGPSVTRTDWQGGVRTNLCPYSQTMDNVAWVCASGTIAPDNAAAPDNTITADTITTTAVSCYQMISVTLPVGPVTVSCYLKALGPPIGKGANAPGIWVWQVGTGVLATQIGMAGYPALTGVWQRYTQTVVVTTPGTFVVRMDLPHSSGGGTIGDAVQVWGVQVEQGSVATPYIATGANPVSVSDVSATVLSSVARTNLCPMTDFSSGWGVVDPAAAGPTGALTARRKTWTSSAYPQIVRSTNIAVVSGQTYTMSAWVKHDMAGVPIGLVSNAGNLAINSSTTSTGAWQRITATAVASGTGAANFDIVFNNSGTSTTSGCNYQFPQLETGSVATAFIDNLTNGPVSVTDYALAAGIVTFPTAPAAGVKLGGVVSPVPLISRGAIRNIRGLEVDTLSITLQGGQSAMLSGIPLVLAAHNGLFDGATVRVERAFMNVWGDTSPGVLCMFEGRVSDVAPTSTEVTLSVKSGLDALTIQWPRNLFMPQCGNVLGDAGCGFNVAASTDTGPITGTPTTTALAATLPHAA